MINILMHTICKPLSIDVHYVFSVPQRGPYSSKTPLVFFKTLTSKTLKSVQSCRSSNYHYSSSEISGMSFEKPSSAIVFDFSRLHSEKSLIGSMDWQPGKPHVARVLFRRDNQISNSKLLKVRRRGKCPN